LASALLLAFLIGPLIAVIFARPHATFVLGPRDAELWRAIGVSFACAASATVLAAVLGTPLAYLLARRSFRGKGAVRAVLTLPLVIPHPVAGIALLIVFARHRLLGSILEGRLGIEVVGAAPGIALAMLFVSAPLLVTTVEEGVHALSPRLEQVAESLGASPWLAFLRVTLPNIRPALVAGMGATFARAVSEFGSIAVLAYFPRTAPVLIWDRFSSWGLDGALPATALLLVVSFAVLASFTLLQGRRKIHAPR
jgi:molybdate/tungstate transport system permease protein